jgi:hypothetical protein
MVESVREIIGGKTESETRFYISSLRQPTPDGRAKRSVAIAASRTAIVGS